VDARPAPKSRVAALRRALAQTGRDILLLRAVRRALVSARFLWFARVRRRLMTLDTNESVAGTLTHNLRGILFIGQRAPQLLRAVSLVEATRGGDCLIVGCRNEDDIFVAKALGFGSVTGVDLISYSPSVRLADMHDLPFPDDSFDAVVVPYTLSYSGSPALAAKEFARVCRPGGAVGIAIEYSPADRAVSISKALMHEQYRGFEPRIDSSAGILALFDPAVIDEVVVNYDALQKRHHTEAGLIRNPSPIIVVLTVRKSTTED
jgi:SAM-dependent methyltransferase